MDARQAAERVYTLKQAIAAMQEEVDELNAKHFSGRDVDTYAEGPFKVVVGRNARFDAGLVRKALAEGRITEEEYESMLMTAPSGTLAKDIVSPAVFRTFQKMSTNKVTVSLPKEND